MSLKKMILGGAAVVGGLAGYALARNRDEVEKMEEAALENVKDENDNVGGPIKSSKDTIVEGKEGIKDKGVKRTAGKLLKRKNDCVGEYFK
jgi:hypothetical protein